MAKTLLMAAHNNSNIIHITCGVAEMIKLHRKPTTKYVHTIDHATWGTLQLFNVTTQ